MKDFESLLTGSEFCDAESFPNDFGSFITGSEFCETDSLPILDFAVFSVNIDILPLEVDFESERPFVRVLPIAYGSMRCSRVEVANIEIIFKS